MAEDDTEDNGSTQASGYTGPASMASLVFNGLVQRGVKPVVAYGAIGSLMGESGSNLALDSINRGDGSDGSDSIGAAQWNGTRAQNLKATAKALRVGWNTPQAQSAHLFNELDGKYGSGGNYSSVLKALQGASSVADGNDIWTRHYEVPANVDSAVASRLKNGLTLNGAAANGTLNLDRLGGLTGSQNIQNGGALSMDSLGGSPSLGALFDYVKNNQQSPGPSFGQRLAMVGAALASASSPGQGAALMSIANQFKPQQPEKVDGVSQLMKALQIKAAMSSIAKADKSNLPQDIGATPDGKARIVQDPTTGAFSAVPVAGGEDHADDGKAEAAKDKLMITQAPKIGDTASTLSESAKIKDEGDRLRYELATNPNIYTKLGWGQNLLTWLKNAEGKSDDASRFIKDFNAYFKGISTAAMSNAHLGRATNMELQAFQDRFAPNGAAYDPITMMQALNRMTEAASNTYSGMSTRAQAYNQQFGDKAPWQFIDSKGNDISYEDFDSNNKKNWQESAKKIQDAYDNQLLPWHNGRVSGKGGSNPREKSFFDFGMGN